MARRKRSFVRRAVSSRRGRRVKRGLMGGGLIGNAFSGFIVGAGIQLAGPTINSYVPRIGPIAPTTAATLGTGIILKSVLHKGGGIGSAALVVGSAMAAHDLLSGVGGGSMSGMTYY